MKPTSGMHELSSFLGIQHFSHGEKFKALEAELRREDYLREVARRRRKKATQLAKFLFFGALAFFLFGGCIAGALTSPKQSQQWIATTVSVSVVLLSAGTMLTAAVVFLREASKSDIAGHKDRVSELNYELAKIREEFQLRVHNMFFEQMKSVGHKPRVYAYSPEEHLLYCRTYSAFVSVDDDALFLLLSTDMRSSTIETREVTRTITGQTTTSSRRPDAVRGALIGGLLFGGDGLTAGAIVGAAGETTHATSSREVVRYVTGVTIYTKLDLYPMMMVNFGQDEYAAKEYFAIISMNAP